MLRGGVSHAARLRVTQFAAVPRFHESIAYALQITAPPCKSSSVTRMANLLVMPRPHMAEALRDYERLTSVCRVHRA